MDASPLSRLPGELRNRIYTFVLTNQHSVEVVDLEGEPTGEAAQPGLVRTCKQIRSESLVLFYSRNTFLIHFSWESHGRIHFVRIMHSALRWLTTLSLSCRDSIARLIVSIEWVSILQCVRKVRFRLDYWLRLGALLREAGFEDERIVLRGQIVGPVAETVQWTRKTQHRSLIRHFVDWWGLDWSRLEWFETLAEDGNVV